VFLDTNVWIDLAEQETDASRECLDVLRQAVAGGSLLCPLAAPVIWELYKQDYPSALRVANVMDALSLSTTFASTDDVNTVEVESCLQSLLTDKPSPIPRRSLLVPLLGYLSSANNLVFNDSWSSEDRKRATQLVAERVRALTVTDLIDLAKDSLSRPERNEAPPYSSALRRRADFAKGDRAKAWLAEAHEIVLSMALPKLNALRSRLPLASQLNILAASERLPKDRFKSRMAALLERLPSMLVRTEIMTLSGFDVRRKDSMRDFYDQEMLIIPFTYADAFASQDRWIRHIVASTPVVLTKWPAQFLSRIAELTSFVRSAV